MNTRSKPNHPERVTPQRRTWDSPLPGREWRVVAFDLTRQQATYLARALDVLGYEQVALQEDRELPPGVARALD